LDRLSVTTFPDSTSDTETLSYDADSNIVAKVTRGGSTIAYAYDTLNRVCSKTIAATPLACGGSSGNPTTAYAYDLAGRTTGVSDNSAAIPVPSGASASYVTNLTYDAWNDPVTVDWSPAPAQATPSAASVRRKSSLMLTLLNSCACTHDASDQLFCLFYGRALVSFLN